MMRLCEQIQNAAQVKAPVIISGERRHRQGTLVAHAIHELSKRNKGTPTSGSTARHSMRFSSKANSSGTSGAPLPAPSKTARRFGSAATGASSSTRSERCPNPCPGQAPAVIQAEEIERVRRSQAHPCPISGSSLATNKDLHELVEKGQFRRPSTTGSMSYLSVLPPWGAEGGPAAPMARRILRRIRLVNSRTIQRVTPEAETRPDRGAARLAGERPAAHPTHWSSPPYRARKT
ncbi:MAG: sigma 54-interacting transcriptional regulator [Ignavibacteriales bacterium]|nr:sigma 54-interacting transcriptional regulator [Ignavibacteriales bacterium]